MWHFYSNSDKEEFLNVGKILKNLLGSERWLSALEHWLFFQRFGSQHPPVTHTVKNSGTRDSEVLSSAPQAPGVHRVHRHACRHTHTVKGFIVWFFTYTHVGVDKNCAFEVRGHRLSFLLVGPVDGAQVLTLCNDLVTHRPHPYLCGNHTYINLNPFIVGYI